MNYSTNLHYNVSIIIYLLYKFLNMKKKKLGIFIFDDVEVLDFAGPFEVFSCTRIFKNQNNKNLGISPFEILMISENKRKIITSGGLKVYSDFTFRNHPILDILLLPGGMGTRPLLKKKKVLDWVKSNKNVSILFTVCTGSLLLAKTGLLKDKSAITHWSALNELKKISPTTKILKGNRFVIDTFFTSAGISAGIDISLKIIEKLYGKNIAKNTAKYMEYKSRDY